MKNSILLGAIMVALSFSAQATLIGDTVTGSSTGMTSFSSGSALVTTGGPEFTGTAAGGSGTTFTVDFDFGADFLNIYIESNLSGTTFPADFSVTFSDLDWVGMPTHILSGVTLNYDDPVGTAEGLTPIVDDHSLTLVFTSFAVPEFREIEIALVTEEGSGGPTDPIPEPATIALLGMGLVGLAARRKVG